MIWNEIVCLGDSLTYGARDRYGRSYPAELGSIMSRKTGEFYICHNYGINGETSSDLLRRSWGTLRSNNGAKICLLMIGTNDTKVPIPTHIYRDNMTQLIKSIRANGKVPIVATLPELRFSPYYVSNRDYIEVYNQVIETLAAKENLNFVTCDMSGLGDHLIDGVHLTHEGYKEVAERWSKAILLLK
ncbi:MAG TPA: SGNH/GDSL hydrolase family protein [Flavobacteriales bacterium]|nr:SGNH/GDSL hydrolase family protein [Flavobacteriales bacterium]